MELMDTSLDKFYKFIYERMHERLPENMLGKITVAVSRCLAVCAVIGKEMLVCNSQYFNGYFRIDM